MQANPHLITDQHPWRIALGLSSPVMVGYLALGTGFGLLLSKAGYPWYLGVGMSIFIFAGAAQYLAVDLFARGAGLGEVALVTLVLNSRHLVYGLSLSSTWNTLGLGRWYLAFGLTDETWAVLTSPHNRTNSKTLPALELTILNQTWWVLGTSIGVVLGQILPIDPKHLGFSLTALFAVLAMGHWSHKGRRPWLALGFGLAILVVLLMAGVPHQVSVSGLGPNLALSVPQALIASLVMGLVTFVTRITPFLAGQLVKAPRLVSALETRLPPVIISALVVYALAPSLAINAGSDYSQAVVAVFSLGAILVAHRLWANTLVSIFGGTALYTLLMSLIQP